MTKAKPPAKKTVTKPAKKASKPAVKKATPKKVTPKGKSTTTPKKEVKPSPYIYDRTPQELDALFIYLKPTREQRTRQAVNVMGQPILVTDPRPSKATEHLPVYEKIATLAWELDSPPKEFKEDSAHGRRLRSALKRYRKLDIDHVSAEDLHAAQMLWRRMAEGIDRWIEAVNRRADHRSDQVFQTETEKSAGVPLPSEHLAPIRKKGTGQRDFFGHFINAESHKITLAIFKLKRFTIADLVKESGCEKTHVATRVRQKLQKGFLEKETVDKTVYYSLKKEYHNKKPV